MSIIKKLLLIVVAIAFVQCSNNDKYLIAKGQVGFLTDYITLNSIGDLYEDDSLVNLNIDTTQTFLANSNRELIVYLHPKYLDGDKIKNISSEESNLPVIFSFKCQKRSRYGGFSGINANNYSIRLGDLGRVIEAYSNTGVNINMKFRVEW